MALFSLVYPLMYGYTDKESLVPIYEYSCIECDLDYEKERSIHDSVPEYYCDKCGYALQRVFNSFGLSFKGGGFYSTDGRR
jgi:putative FmdB family regulatory protein